MQLVKGSNGIFDVYEGERRIFSKDEEHRFPVHDEILGEL